MNKKRLLSLLLALVLCVGLLPITASAAATEPVGAGTQTSPYQISSKDNLLWLAAQINSGTTFEGQYLKLTKNLDMTDSTWDTGDSTFAGTLLGNGYTVTLNGQFLYTISETGTVDYLNLKSTETTTTPLLCKTNNGTIQNCRVRGNVTNTVGDAALLCHTNSGTVLNSCGFGSLSGCGDDSDCYVGWIAKNSGTVRSCYTVLSLSAKASGSDNDEFIGGIAASNGGTHENCYTDDAVKANDTNFLEQLNQMGISGYVWSADSSSANEGYPVIKNCLAAETQLSASADSMFAYHSGTLTTKITCSLSGCTVYYTTDGSDPRSSSTRKSLSSTSSLNVTGDTVIRTVAYKNGSYSRPITQYAICLPGSGTETSPYEISTNLGLYAMRFEPEKVYRLAADLDFTGESYVHNGVVTDGWESIPSFSGTLQGDRHSITGLCGSTGGLVDGNSGTIQELRLLEHRLYRESFGHWNSTAGNFGAVANSNSGTITRCYAASDLSVVLKTKISVYNTTGVGGIVGRNYSDGIISYCYSSGDLRTASAASPPVPYMGGIAGYNEGTIQSCYSDIHIYTCHTSHDMGSIVGGITTSGGSVFDCRFDGTCTIDSYMISIGLGIAKFGGRTVFSYRCYDGGATFTPTGGSRIYRSTEYNKYQTTNSGADRLEASFPEFDFDTVWMITEEGPMPQGVMQADGNYYTKISYTAPTTDADGETVCAVNGTSETISFPLSALENDDPCAAGHSFTNYVSNNDATCTEDGTKTSKCDKCDETDTITDKGSATGHDFSDDAEYCKNGCGTKNPDAEPGEVDSQPPVIHQDTITIDPKTASIGDTVTITVDVTDNVAIDWVTIDLWNRDTNLTESCHTTRIDGTDTYRCDFVVTEETSAGTWYIREIYAFDTIGNSDTLTFSPDEYTFTVTGESEPKTTIQDDDITIDKELATVGDVVTISVRIDRTDIDRVTFSLVNYDVSGHNSTDLAYAQYDEESGCYVWQFAVDETIPVGFWKISSLFAYNANGNNVAYYPGTKGFTVYDTPADAEAPVIDLSSFQISKKTIDRGETSVLSIKVTDNDVIERVYFWLSNKDTGKVISGATATYNAATDRYEYEFTADNTIPSGHWRVSSVAATDITGNSASKSIFEYILVKGEYDHDWQDATCTEPKTCKTCGETDGEALGHDWADATCTEPKTCKTCGETEGEALGHDWSDATCTEPKTCKTCGETEGEALGHDWADATCTEPRTCRTCGETEGEALGHDWAEATCTEPKTCKTCGATEGEALGHDWAEATCTEPKTCKTCGATEGEALGHDWADATCTEPKNCKTCGETEGEALGHDWADATCTEPKTCKTCGETDGEALGHDWADATCTEPKTCKTCGETEGEALGHDWADATCTEPKTCRTCGATEGEALGHDWTEATCTEPKTCKTCGETEGEALGHDWADATCTEPKTCKTCGETEGEALGHDWADATCTEPKTCKTCGETEGEALGHDWADATCTEPKTCRTCGATEGEALGHDWAEATCTEPKTCRTCGETEGEALGHDWSEATCTEPKTCRTCGETEGEALGHDWADATCTEPKTCKTCGETEGEALGHDWADATCTEPKTCRTCGETEGEALGHDWADATCTEPKTCRTCGETEGEALGHDWDDATCTEPKTCKTCGETDGEALGHDWADATCTEPKTCRTCGETDGEALGHDWADATCTEPKTCKTCGETEGEALGHDWAEATCTEPKTCKTCGATEGEALGHDWDDATCTEPKTCKTCGATEGEALGHDWADATCTEPKTCKTCGATEGEALGHDWADATCTEPKTCKTCGETEGEALGHDWAEATCTEPKTCKTCGETDGEALGHDWADATCTEPKTCKTCGETDGEALGHDWAEATCTEPKTCKTCGETEGEALGHDFSNNAEYCRRGCGARNPDYTEPVRPPYTPVKPAPTPTPTPEPTPEPTDPAPEPVVPEQPENPENPFTDVNENDYFFDSVIWAVDNGITSGTGATTFDPNKICTRAEMVTFLWRTAGSPEPVTRDNPFMDVDENDYFYKAVLWAVENGITKGTSSTTFSPNDTCTRGQAVTFLYRYAGSPEVTGSNPFVDVHETDYFYHAVIWAVAEGITNGTSATTFAPDDLCTRAQIVTFLYRYQQD